MREFNVTYTKKELKQNLSRQQEEFFLIPRVKIQNANNIGGIVPEHVG